MLACSESIYENEIESPRVLAIDDSRTMRAILERTFRKIANLQVETLGNPTEAIATCQSCAFDLVMVDYLMPEMNGIDVVRHLRRIDAYRTTPIIMLTSEGDREIRMNALSAGVNDFLNKPFDPFELRVRVSNMLALRAAQKKQERLSAYLTNDVAQAMRDLALREQEMIWRLALAVEARDGGTGSHIARVAKISRRLALAVGLSKAHSDLIGLAAPLHDVGKIGVADAILTKKAPLTPDEQEAMRQHVAHGVNILRDGETELVKVAAAIVGGHHERWDGTGYPAGLCGEDIPIEARVVAVADVFDALCVARAYKEPWTLDAAFAEIVAGAGKHFDPACVEAFTRIEDEIREMRLDPPRTGAAELFSFSSG